MSAIAQRATAEAKDAILSFHAASATENIPCGLPQGFAYSAVAKPLAAKAGLAKKGQKIPLINGWAKEDMELRFTSPCKHTAGTVFHLLKLAWEPLWNPKLEENIRQFDNEVTEHPDTVGECTFVTCIDFEPVGMGSYDPRQQPEQGLIGWNCIVPKHQGKASARHRFKKFFGYSEAEASARHV